MGNKHSKRKDKGKDRGGWKDSKEKLNVNVKGVDGLSETYKLKMIRRAIPDSDRLGPLVSIEMREFNLLEVLFACKKVIG